MANATPNLGLPLNVQGHVALQRTVKEGFEKIDAAIGSGGSLSAANVAYNSDGDSNSTGDTVAAALDDLYREVNALRAALNSSNSGDIPAL